MSRSAEDPIEGSIFDEVAADYDRHRPAYPDVLIDHACAAAGLSAGDAVLEIGCGTGQLTRSLRARGLRVTAVEPGPQLVQRARRRLAPGGGVRFITARLEDAVLPDAAFTAVFAASSIHWVDPDLSWRRAADTLADGGTLVLMSYFGLDEPRTAADQRAVRDGLAAVAPELAAAWPSYRSLESILTGADARRANVSEVWAWLGDYALARRYAHDLFDDARITVEPTPLEHTGAQLTALLGTMSFWAGLTPGQRAALAAEMGALQRRLGRPIRSSTAACVVTARRRARHASPTGAA